MKRSFRNIILLSGAATFFAVALGSCFTGIESTPKITAGDVKRENIVQRPEDTYLSDIKPEPFSEWKQGKRFYVSDNKFEILLQPSDKPFPQYQGTEISFLKADETTDITGNRVAELTFVDNLGRHLVYRASQSLETLKENGSLSIPFLVEMSVVDAVKERLEGKSFYVITSSWYDENTQSRRGRKFVPVKVVDVKPGNAFYSVVLEMSDEHGKPFRLLVSAGDDLKTLRSFGNIFSFKDPRQSYPQITNDIWELIVNGKVKSGMTREECRLSLGSPANVDKSAGYSSLREIWSYENGAYLIFIDGLLQSYRI